MTRTVIALLFLASCAPAPTNAAIIYREIFPNSTGGNQDLNVDGWQIHFAGGTKLTDQTNSPNFSAPNNTLAGVNSLPSNAPPVNGYSFAGAGATNDYLFWTNEYTVNRAVDSVTSISWWQGNQSSSAISRAAVQIGAQWYASTQTFTDTSGGIVNAQQKTLDFTTATWRLLDFVPGSSLALGAATALPAGNFVGFGWYLDTNAGVQLRMDTFEINAVPVPEPSTGLLLTAAGVLLPWARRSRRNR